MSEETYFKFIKHWQGWQGSFWWGVGQKEEEKISQPFGLIIWIRVAEMVKKLMTPLGTKIVLCWKKWLGKK